MLERDVSSPTTMSSPPAPPAPPPPENDTDACPLVTADGANGLAKSSSGDLGDIWNGLIPSSGEKGDLGDESDGDTAAGNGCWATMEESDGNVPPDEENVRGIDTDDEDVDAVGMNGGAVGDMAAEDEDDD